MEEIGILQWAAGGAVALVVGGMVHLHLRIIEIERQLVEIVKGLREETSRDMRELWAAREKDRELREDDQKQANAFRQFVFTSLATKEDIAALEIRVSTAVRMIMNERRRTSHSSDGSSS